MHRIEIPEKLYFKIGEVAELAAVEPYVLRYWETEFSDIAPLKSRTNQRLYKRKDVELVLQIKHLLYDEKFTINGARKRLKEDSRRKTSDQPTPQLGFELESSKNDQPLKFEEISRSIKELLLEMEKALID